MAPAPHPPVPGSRNAGLDAARALAVVAMVLGHTSDALLSVEARSTALFATYSTFRGMTAPLFLFVSGWAVMTRALRGRLQGADVLRKHLSRAGLLVLVGLALRWPTWDVPGLFAGRVETWWHWVGMDALGCIAVSLVLSGLVLAAPLGARGRVLALGGVAVGAVAAATWLAAHPPRGAWTFWLVASSESPFPLAPWTGHFFAGALAGTFVHATPARGRQALGLLAAGAFGLLGTWVWGLDGLPLWSPTLFVYRLSFASAVGGFMLLVPERWTREASPVGQASLLTYVLHLPVIYGWGSFQGLGNVLGRALSPLQVLLLGAIFVTVGVSASVLWRRVRRASIRLRGTVGRGTLSRSAIAQGHASILEEDGAQR